jgi:hypothetical protein
MADTLLSAFVRTGVAATCNECSASGVSRVEVVHRYIMVD